jgi:hypothetical protein
MAKKRKNKKSSFPFKSYVITFFCLLGVGTSFFWLYQGFFGSGGVIPILEGPCQPVRKAGLERERGKDSKSLAHNVYQKLSQKTQKRVERLLPSTSLDDNNGSDASHSIDQVLNEDIPVQKEKRPKEVFYQIGRFYPDLRAAEKDWDKQENKGISVLKPQFQKVSIKKGVSGYRIVVRGLKPQILPLLKKSRLPYQRILSHDVER